MMVTVESLVDLAGAVEDLEAVECEAVEDDVDNDVDDDDKDNGVEQKEIPVLLTPANYCLYPY